MAKPKLSEKTEDLIVGLVQSSRDRSIEEICGDFGVSRGTFYAIRRRVMKRAGDVKRDDTRDSK